MEETITDGRLKRLRTGLMLNALAGLMPVVAVIVAILTLGTSVTSLSDDALPIIVPLLMAPALMLAGTTLMLSAIHAPELRKAIMPCCLLSALMIIVIFIVNTIRIDGTISYAMALAPFVVTVMQTVAFMLCAGKLFQMSDLNGINRVYNSCVYMLVSLALIAVGLMMTIFAPGGCAGIISAVGGCAVFSSSIFWCIGWAQAWHSAKDPVEIDTDTD